LMLLVLWFACALFFTCDAISCSSNQQLWTLACADVFTFQGYGIQSLSLQIQRCVPGKRIAPGQCSDPLQAIINVNVSTPGVATSPFTKTIDLTQNLEIPVVSPFIYLQISNLTVTPTSVVFTIGAKICVVSCSLASKTANIYTLRLGDPSVDPCSLPEDVQCPADNCTSVNTNSCSSSLNGAQGGVSGGVFITTLIALFLVIVVQAVFLIIFFRKWRSLASGSSYNLFDDGY